MKIYFKKKLICVVNNISDLEIFIKKNNFYKYFIKFPLSKHIDIQNKINNTEKLSYKMVKSWVKEVLNYPGTIYNYDFLYSMGWDNEDIINFISIKQKDNSKILSNKKRENPDHYFSATTSRVEYWVTKGYSIEESKIMVSNRQKTFSKEICIQKFGKEKGIERFNDRQKKWINTLINLENYKEIQKKKNCYNQNNKNILDLINQATFTNKTKNLILKHINLSSIDEFVDKIIEDIDVKRYSDIYPFYSSVLVNKKFGTSIEYVKNLFLKKIFYSIKKQVYGTPVYHNGIRFKSIKEYELSLFFEKNDINYVYEGNYPNSMFKYDFYLPQRDCYIEYYGMLDGKNLENLDETQKKYKLKMELKNKFCYDQNLNLIQNTDYSKLINELKKII